MSGFKVGDEVVITENESNVVATIVTSKMRGLYRVQTRDGILDWYPEDGLQLKSEFESERKVATLSEIRDLLLSDEFMTAFAKKFFSTPLPSTIIPGNSASVICGIDKAKGDSFGVIYEWAGKENEVSE